MSEVNPIDQRTPPSARTLTSPRWTGALAGMAAGGAALAAGEVAGAVAAPKPGPVIAVSNRVIDHAPAWFVNFGKDVFGLADKPALIAGTILFSIAFATVLGVLSLRRFAIGASGIVAFGLIGMAAMGVDAQGGWGYAVLVSLLATTTGIAVLALMIARAPTRPATGSSSPGVPTGDGLGPDGAGRRSFLGWAGAAAATIAGLALGARTLRARAAVEEARRKVDLVAGEDADALAQVVESAESSDVATTPGISELITPNDDFYLIDTATLVPQVDPENWTLTIRGMVEREKTYSYDELLARATTIVPVTLSCVSNEVGGRLVGNAVWQGVPLTDLLDEAGVQDGATQIRSASVDGWDCGFPTEAAYDGRTALVAVGMNGEPLPVDHGFPARLVVAGLYGYVSATKWLKEIELTTWDDFDGYWVPRGWSKLGPVKTQSRIDTPRDGARLVAQQRVPVAGVAWAPDTGIAKVEVQVDDGPWSEATLGESLGENAWIQWSLAWTPAPGDHVIRVRATDATGQTQTERRTRPAPNGATGWHTIGVRA